MTEGKIDKLIINSPYEEPKKYWFYDQQTKKFILKNGRRPAGYVIASEASKSFDDPGVFIPIELVNRIRDRVSKWRKDGYPGVTGITKRLLDHWVNRQGDYKLFFFCQIEAIETIIWLTEAPETETAGIEIPGDGGLFRRLCSKMATGSGKTLVMAMLIAWQVLNKVTYPTDPRFSKNVFIVAPGLTVKNRLSVLLTSDKNNFYQQFGIVPPGLWEKFNQGKIIIKNWQSLSWESENTLSKKKTVDKRGAKSDEAYTREVLGDMSKSKNIIVINDEAHHAWRVAAGIKTKGLTKEEEEATKWIGGLDRINRTRNILCCYDFTATPFWPSGKKASEDQVFRWIISDFGLNDAIEAGLVKTPRVVIRDDGIPDAKTYKSKLYHIYPHVKDDLNRKAKEEETLPDLVRNAYYLLGKDWLETKKLWEEQSFPTSPVMITVANRTETAARVRYAFEHKDIMIDELCDKNRLLHIDSKVLDEAEGMEEPETEEDLAEKKKLTKKEATILLRDMVDTVGKIGESGQDIQNVISVGMLSEGWDAKTVTHIMGLRAFTSQLLCEQVVGRGLRRTSYDVGDDGLFIPEYVNIFGVPFTFLPHEDTGSSPPRPPSPKFRIEADPEKAEYEIEFPNVIRIDRVYRPKLILDLDSVENLVIDAADTKMAAEMAPILQGKPDLTKCSEIEIKELGEKYRTQRIMFEVTRKIYESMKKTDWEGPKHNLIGQIMKNVELFMNSDKIKILPEGFGDDELRRRVLLIMNMSSIVHQLWSYLNYQNAIKFVPVFDKSNPIKSTGDMQVWYTGKPCEIVKKSHINMCVFDSTWEETEAFILDKNENVDSWVKNDHLGFDIIYVFGGAVHKYRPDFIVKLKNGDFLILETKGQETKKDKVKRKYLREWIKAINECKSFGRWHFEFSSNVKDVEIIIKRIVQNF